MKTSLKFSLILVLFIAVGSGLYFYLLKNNEKRLSGIEVSGDIASKAISEIDELEYSQELSLEERSILEEFALSREFDAEPSDYILYYYDPTRVLIGTLLPKPTHPISLIKRSSWEPVKDSCVLNSWSGFIRTKKYLISVSDSGICYYKAGDSNTTLIEDTAFEFSNVPGPENETYVKKFGYANTYDVAFDETTRVLSVGVFRELILCTECIPESRQRMEEEGKIDSGYGDTDPDNPKLRTEQYILH